MDTHIDIKLGDDLHLDLRFEKSPGLYFIPLFLIERAKKTANEMGKDISEEMMEYLKSSCKFYATDKNEVVQFLYKFLDATTPEKQEQYRIEQEKIKDWTKRSHFSVNTSTRDDIQLIIDIIEPLEIKSFHCYVG